MFCLYHVSMPYLEYLREVEPRVPYAYGRKGKRPFLGVVIQIQNKQYFAPLGSPKEKHEHMQEAEDFLKIQKGELGVINFNNMIPIPITQCELMQLQEITDRKYRMLLKNQLKWCNQHQDQIKQKANDLYHLICLEENSFLQERCCDFSLLEKRYYCFITSGQVKETTAQYRFA